MLNVGGGELLIILLLALIVLGPTRLPEAARTIGKVVSEARKISQGFQREFREAMDDPVAAAMKDRDDNAALPPVADSDPFHAADSSASIGVEPPVAAEETATADAPVGESSNEPVQATSSEPVEALVEPEPDTPGFDEPPPMPSDR